MATSTNAPPPSVMPADSAAAQAASVVPGVPANAGDPSKAAAVHSQELQEPPAPDTAGPLVSEKLSATPAAAAESTLKPPPTEVEEAMAASNGIDEVNPHDFHGEVQSSDDLPSAETLRKIENYVVLDRHGKSHTFKSLYSGRNVARRVLILFVRHFFCGNCQEYLRSLSASITPEALLGLPISTFIAVVGCGGPALIDMYARETACPFPIYADPTRRLYDELGMVRTLAMGARPAYMRKSMAVSIVDSVVQGLRQIPKGLATKGGDQRQIGGEFLFEPLSVLTPHDDIDRRIGDHRDFHSQLQQQQKQQQEKGATPESAPKSPVVAQSEEEGEDEADVEEKRVTWCHRMRTTRDHAEIPELMEVLGLEGQGQPTIKDMRRWSKALESRKGTGLSLASQMSALKVDTVSEASAETRDAKPAETPPAPAGGVV